MNQETICMEVDREAMYVAMDADHLIHLYHVCVQYGEHLVKRLHKGTISVSDYTSEVYQIGYMHGRIEAERLTEKDLKVMSEWEQELDKK